MNDRNKVREYVLLVEELRRMHRLYSRPWNRHDRAAIERCEEQIDVMTAAFITEDAAHTYVAPSPVI